MSNIEHKAISISSTLLLSELFLAVSNHQAMCYYTMFFNTSFQRQPPSSFEPRTSKSPSIDSKREWQSILGLQNFPIMLIHSNNHQRWDNTPKNNKKGSWVATTMMMTMTKKKKMTTTSIPGYQVQQQQQPTTTATIKTTKGREGG